MITDTPMSTASRSITVEARQLGGWNPGTSFYPVCPAAKLLASIIGSKTLTNRVLQLLRDSEQYTITITHPTTTFDEEVTR